MFKLIVLDRDGVINEDSPFYIKSPDEWHAIPGSLEAIAKLQHSGYSVAIATNQSGIARHYFTAETLDSVHKKMIAQITVAGGHLDMNDIFVCPHRPEDNCKCRKPKPGLLLQAAHKFNVAPEEILVIGDAVRDILAAKACGAAAILVKTGKGMETLKAEIDVPIYADLAEAVDSL
ncbi:D-glycero-beta-D-manno-heptose-1,7-bisphosphate 7-phosphatase [Gammaproteobacteria bacterium]